MSRLESLSAWAYLLAVAYIIVDFVCGMHIFLRAELLYLTAKRICLTMYLNFLERNLQKD